MAIVFHFKHVRRQRNDDSQNRLLHINYCEKVEFNFQEVKTKAFWLKPFLLGKFVVPLVGT
jgi:hypothetical protein